MLYIIQSILYRKSKPTAKNILNEINDFISLLPLWKEKPKEWFIAHPTKTIIAISSEGISYEAIDYVDETISKKKSISISLAGDKKDESPFILWFKNTPAISENRYSLTLAIRSPQTLNDKITFSHLLMNVALLNFWEYRYILLETEQYKMEQRNVFEDRIPAGWMLYLPKEVKSNEVPSASEVILFPNNAGTLIITKDFFNGKDNRDVIFANNVEIELAANGHLPKWVDL